MSDFDSNEAEMLDEVPRRDMLSVKFRGDSDPIVLPYCEVANGDITKIDTIERHITINTETKDPAIISFESFVNLIQETFDTKDVVQLFLQQSGSYDSIQIL